MRRVHLLLFIISCSAVHAQYLKGPIVLNGSIPAEFKEVINRKYTDVPLYKAKKEPRYAPMFAATDSRVKLILSSGKVLYGDTLTAYVRKLADKLIPFVPNLTIKPRFYVEIDNYPNAYTYADGTIIFTTGLLSRLNTESQLAFIMGHEMSHYANDHSVKEFEKSQKTKKDFGSDYYDQNTRTRMLFYSREFESDADASGLEIVMKAGYNGFDAIKALKSTDDIDSQYTAVISLKKYFQNDPFKLDSTAGSSSSSSDDEGYYRKSKGKSKKGARDDRQSTHPNLEKRGIALAEILQNMSQKQPPSSPDDSAIYLKIKNIAAMEMPEAAYMSGNYIEGLYSSLYLLEKYPDNNYLEYMTARHLLQIAYCQDIDSLLYGQKSSAGFGKGYEQLNNFIRDLRQNESKKLAYSYIKHLYAKKSNIDEINFYMGDITEFYLGIHVAQIYYSKYLEAFPNGKYAVLAKSKMNLK